MFNSNPSQQLADAERELQEAQRVQRERLEKEKQVQENIIAAEAKVKRARQHKAAQDWQEAVAANAPLLAANHDAIAHELADLGRVLGGLRQLLASRNNQVEETFRAQWQHTRQAVGAVSRALIAEKMDRGMDGKAAAIEVSLELDARARQFESALSTETILGLWLGQASDPDDHNARAALMLAILGYIVDLKGVSNEQAQDRMNSELWKQFQGHSRL